MEFESHGNGSFLVSLGLVGGSKQSQGKTVNVQYGTQHPSCSTTEYAKRTDNKNKTDDKRNLTTGRPSNALDGTPLLQP